MDIYFTFSSDIDSKGYEVFGLCLVKFEVTYPSTETSYVHEQRFQIRLGVTNTRIGT